MSRLGFDADDLPAPRYWRTSEERTLREHYPAGGADAVQALLPHRSRDTIRMRARALGVRSHRGSRAAQGGKAG
jgi:hypothetical protein